VSDIGELLWKRRIFRDLVEVSKNSPQVLEPGAFVEWSRHSYALTTAVGGRRCIDTDRRSISLGRLLYELVECPGVLTAQRTASTEPVPQYTSSGSPPMARLDPGPACSYHPAQ
jgi:hypothetical protein